MKETKPYWYCKKAYSMEPYFVLSSFPEPPDMFSIQCLKLTVHSAPGAHISLARCTFFRHVCPDAHVNAVDYHSYIFEECTGKSADTQVHNVGKTTT